MDVRVLSNLVCVEAVSLRIGLIIESATATRKVAHIPTTTMIATDTNILGGWTGTHAESGQWVSEERYQCYDRENMCVKKQS